jgi:23S rRNA pseudouridine2604 synthase
MSAPLRLDKRVVELLRCSRSEAQAMIEAGAVRVDGRVVDTPQTPVTDERVEIDASVPVAAAAPATMMLHKPAGMRFLDAIAQVRPDTRAADDVSPVRMRSAHFRHLHARLPLDHEASGLVVLSQDGRVLRRLSEDYASLEQELIVEVAGTPPAEVLPRLAAGLDPRAKVSWQNECRLRFALKNLQPGQLRPLCTQAGLELVAIKRIRVGRIPLRGLAPGEWRYLAGDERF